MLIALLFARLLLGSQTVNTDGLLQMSPQSADNFIETVEMIKKKMKEAKP